MIIANQDENYMNMITIKIGTYLEGIHFSLYRSSIDYFSLNIGGNILNILQTIPFNKFDIGAFQNS